MQKPKLIIGSIVVVAVATVRYQSVTIWCRRSGVNFATAPLTAPKRT